MTDDITPPLGFEPPSGPPISDDDAEALLGGIARPGHEDLERTIAGLRSVPRLPVGVGPELGEFVAVAPTRPPFIDELAPAPTAAPDRRPPLLARPLARLALTAGIGLVGVTGAHAAGVVDVPGFGDRGDGTEIVAGDDDDPTETARPAGDVPASGQGDDADGSILEDPVEATVTYGDLSVAISVGSADGQSVTIHIDVEGVSPECEAALEGLSGTYTSGDDAEAAAVEAEAACAGDVDLLVPDLDDPAAFESFLGEFDFSLDLPDDLGRFFDQEFGGLGAFDLDQLEQLLDDFDFQEFERHMGEHGPGGFSFDLDQLDGLLGGLADGIDPDELERFLDELPFDLDELDGDHRSEIDEFLDDFFQGDIGDDEIGSA